MSESTLGTTAVAQIGIIVGDIETKVRAWAELLRVPAPDIRVTDIWENTRTEHLGQPTPARAKLAFFHLANLDIELIEPLGEPSTWQDQLAQHGDSLHHIAFKIQGMPAKLAALDNQHIPPLQRGEYKGGRYAYLDSVARLGAVLELLENDAP